MYYFGARYYDPLTGRFTTRDTVFGSLNDPQSQNRYVYCLNNPHKYIDPDGHIVVTATLLLWAAFGGAVGLNAYGVYNHLVRNNGNIETAGSTYNGWEAAACTLGGAAVFAGGFQAYLLYTSSGYTVSQYASEYANTLTGWMRDTPRHIQHARDMGYRVAQYGDDAWNAFQDEAKRFIGEGLSKVGVERGWQLFEQSYYDSQLGENVHKYIIVNGLQLGDKVGIWEEGRLVTHLIIDNMHQLTDMMKDWVLLAGL